MHSSGATGRSVEEYIAAARREIARRAVRARTLDPDYFGEPAWNILLDLYVGTFEGRGATYTTSVVIASQAPATTGLRYVTLLEAAGEIERMPNPADARVSMVVLTSDGRARIETALAAMIAAEEGIPEPRAGTICSAAAKRAVVPGVGG